jgi:hypothetical protein
VVERFEIFLADVPGALFTRADGKATVVWSGIEDEAAVLDAAIAEVVAACRTERLFGYR